MASYWLEPARASQYSPEDAAALRRALLLVADRISRELLSLEGVELAAAGAAELRGWAFQEALRIEDDLPPERRVALAMRAAVHLSSHLL